MKHAIATALLTLAGLAPMGVHPAAPRLYLPCNMPGPSLMTCRLSGHGFYRHERIRVTYRIVIDRTGHKQTRMVYRRNGSTDGQGSFTRPPLSFAIDRHVYAFTVTVSVAGARGDHVTDDFSSIFN